jgi:hypothetical protein
MYNKMLKESVFSILSCIHIPIGRPVLARFGNTNRRRYFEFTPENHVFVGFGQSRDEWRTRFMLYMSWVLLLGWLPFDVMIICCGYDILTNLMNSDDLFGKP